MLKSLIRCSNCWKGHSVDMKKRWITTIAVMSIMFLLEGCLKENSTQDNPEETSSQTKVTIDVAPTVEITPSEVVEEFREVGYNTEELKVLSEELTTQVIDGDCSAVNSYLTDELRETYTANVLKKAYDDTVAPLGEFVAIDSSVPQEIEDIIYVAVLLQYENGGLQMLYGFTKDIQLMTFHLSYITLEDENEDVSEFFEEIEIKVGADPYQMDGILTVPKGEPLAPVVILVQGSGQSDMDETIGATNNKPFRDLAHGLAENGIASIRYNKRYYQFTDNIPDDITIKEEILDDVNAAIEYAKKSHLINATKIFVAGHSQGGMLAPKIATDHPELAGIIVLAGSPRNLEDIIYDQAVYFSKLDESLSDSEIELYLQMMQANVEMVKSLDEEALDTQIMGVTGYYWKSLNDLDLPTITQQLTLPMLFLQGSSDFQVYADKDFTEYKQLLQDHDNATFILYDGLNHLFMPTTGALDVTDYDYENEVDEKVIKDIAEWIKKNS